MGQTAVNNSVTCSVSLGVITLIFASEYHSKGKRLKEQTRQPTELITTVKSFIVKATDLTCKRYKTFFCFIVIRQKKIACPRGLYHKTFYSRS
jgi:hypothetical protein